MPDKKPTEVTVVGVAPQVAAEVRATQIEDKKVADVIREKTDIVAENLKTADEERKKTEEEKETRREAKEESKDIKAAKSARFALVIKSIETVVLALFLGLPLMITAWRVGAQDAKLTSIHGWVNSGMRIQLEEKLKVAEELAMLTMDPKHIRQAETYKEQLAEHDRQQAKQDAKKE